jgi:cbb3-type cytochrome oxidase cytochrome c subunit/mono/diheme cytochrome c family protein
MTGQRTALLVASLGGVGFFAMSVLVLAVWPGRVLEDETRKMAPKNPLPLTASEQRGRDIYSREGCAYCHTQQVRELDRDITRFGKSTEAWETRFDYPHLWGTRRIGPDLARESSIRSDDWQLSHLYAPRAVVPDSVMPAFPSLFNGAPDQPLQEARDLLAYLSTLGKARELAEDGPVNASPASTRREGRHPQLASVAGSQRGRDIYAHNCAGCHGSRGEGDGPAAAGLAPHPANLTGHEYTDERLAFDLWNGIAGSAMPGWRDVPVADLAALAAVVREFHAASAEPAPPQQIVDLGQQVYKDNCAQCHGENGAGDGPAGREIRMAPANFVTGRPSVAESLRTLRNGVEGTPMAPWNRKLSEAELSAVAYYVRSFYK